MELFDTASTAHQHFVEFFHSNTWFFLCIGALVLLRFFSLVVESWGEPYSYTAYIGRGGRSPQNRQNSEPVERPWPPLLILKQ